MPNPTYILYAIPGAFIAYMFREFTVALVSTKLGDPLPKARHKLTLNPFTHFDPLGFICLIVTGYGWGKPVETSDLFYKERKKGTVLTYTAPMFVNFLLGMGLISLYTVIYSAYIKSALPMPSVAALCQVLKSTAYINVGMAFFHLIPVYPLSGAKILALYVSPIRLRQMEAYGKIARIVLIVFMATGVVRFLLSPFENVFLMPFTNLLPTSYGGF